MNLYRSSTSYAHKKDHQEPDEGFLQSEQKLLRGGTTRVSQCCSDTFSSYKTLISIHKP